MKMTNQVAKTHYRKVFKSDHLGQADLEDFQEAGSQLIFTIASVRQEMGAKVAGKKIDANIAYFKERIKPLVLNATNSATMKKLTGSAFVEDWHDITIQLYIDPNVKMKGDTVGGVRISHIKPKLVKQQVTKDNQELWDRAKASYSKTGDFTMVLKRADITPENQQLIKDELANV
tara:strand:+ start:101 stop:625 length:525 start_codon:yes stop_codon:yes gene_type:complete